MPDLHNAHNLREKRNGDLPVAGVAQNGMQWMTMLGGTNKLLHLPEGRGTPGLLDSETPSFR